jgi:hypothetical protein
MRRVSAHPHRHDQALAEVGREVGRQVMYGWSLRSMMAGCRRHNGCSSMRRRRVAIIGAEGLADIDRRSRPVQQGRSLGRKPVVFHFRCWRCKGGLGTGLLWRCEARVHLRAMRLPGAASGQNEGQRQHERQRRMGPRRGSWPRLTATQTEHRIRLSTHTTRTTQTGKSRSVEAWPWLKVR